MNQKILCILPICINPTNTSSNKGLERIEQYISGLNKFFEYIDILNKYTVDIIIFDNTINKTEKLPEKILNIIPDNVKIINDNVNKDKLTIVSAISTFFMCYLYYLCLFTFPNNIFTIQIFTSTY